MNCKEWSNGSSKMTLGVWVSIWFMMAFDSNVVQQYVLEKNSLWLFQTRCDVMTTKNAVLKILLGTQRIIGKGENHESYDANTTEIMNIDDGTGQCRD